MLTTCVLFCLAASFLGEVLLMIWDPLRCLFEVVTAVATFQVGVRKPSESQSLDFKVAVQNKHCNVLHAGFPFQIPSNELIFVYFLTISRVLDKRAPRVFGMKIYQDPCATALLAEGRSNHGHSG